MYLYDDSFRFHFRYGYHHTRKCCHALCSAIKKFLRYTYTWDVRDKELSRSLMLLYDDAFRFYVGCGYRHTRKVVSRSFFYHQEVLKIHLHVGSA